MKEKIDRLSKGIFDYNLNCLMTSEEEITLTVETGTTYHGSFRVYNHAGRTMKGIVYSKNRLFVLDDSKFIGEDNQIRYHFNAGYLEEGSLITGDVSIISDCGERLLPFQITVERKGCDSSLLEIQDMNEFTNLAKRNWEDARKLFLSEEFKRLLFLCEKKYLTSYEALIKSNDKNHALEEFLIVTQKKESIHFSVNKIELNYEAGSYNFIDKIMIKKDNWGFIQLKVISTADFVDFDKTMITSEDFINHEFGLNFVIKAEKMKSGFHYGKIIVEGIHQKAEITITCHVSGKGKQLDRKKRILQNKLTENYLKFRTNQISVKEYIKEAEKSISALHFMQKDNLLDELYRVHLLLAGGKESVATSLFSSLKIEKDKVKPEVYVAYLYINTLIKKQKADIEKICEEISELFQKNENNWFIFWVLLYLDKRYDLDKQKKYADIKTFILKGCKSPIIYFEVAVLLKEDASLLKEIGGFEQRILMFHVRRGFFSHELGIAINYLALREKKFNFLIYHILCGFYTHMGKILLKAICSMLIRGHKLSPKYFPWYQLGMKEQLKIAELPEYYLVTAEAVRTKELEPFAYTFYLGQTNLDAKKKAFLYSCIINSTEISEQVLQNSLEDITKFAKDELAKGAISKDLSIIYKKVLRKEILDTTMFTALPSILFSWEINCENKKIKQVCIVHKEMEQETIVTLQDGKAIFDVYSEDAQLFLVDQNGNRYHNTIAFTIEKLMEAIEYAELCYNNEVYDKRILLYLLENKINLHNREPGPILLKEKAVLITGLREEFIKKYKVELIYYYYDNFLGEFLDKYLLLIDLGSVPHKDRIHFIEFMMIRGLYQIALKAMEEFNYEGIDIKRISNLCSKLIQEADDRGKGKGKYHSSLEKIDIILTLCFYAFWKGIYDEYILQYLVDYYLGTTEEMFQIWKVAKNRSYETVELEERLLGQMLFSESNIQNSHSVFVSYYRNGLNHKLIRAYLSYYSYKYLRNDVVMEDDLFDILKKEISCEGNMICLLAVLKYLSNKEMLSDSEVTFIDYRLHELEEKGIELPFFKNFSSHMKIPQQMKDKYYVEYITDPNLKVKIHYKIDHLTGSDDHEDNKEYQVSEMKHVCYGIFTHSFVLFYGEKLKYYITEEQEVISRDTAVPQLISNDTGVSQLVLEEGFDTAEETKYHKLNKVLAAKERGDEAAMHTLLDDYIKLDYSVFKLFHMI